MFRSLIFKILAGMVAIVLPVNVFVIICVQMLTKASMEHIYSETQSTLNVYIDKLDKEIYSTEKLFVQMKRDEDYLNILAGTRDSWGEYDFMRSQTEIGTQFSDFLAPTDLVGGIAAMFDAQDVLIARDRSSSMDRGVTEWIKNSEPETQSWKVQKIKGQWYIVRQVLYEDTQLFAWLRLADIESYFQSTDGNDHGFYLVDSQGQIIGGASGPDTKQACVRMDSYTLPLAMVRNIGGSEFQFLPVTTDILKIVSGVTLCAIPLLLFLMGRQVLLPVSRLTKAIGAVKNGNMDYRIKNTSSSSEFNAINASFNSMMDRIQTLKDGVYEEKIEKQKIQMEYLSHQVQPHFVLNALNILYCYQPGEYPLMQKTIKYLMKYFRYIVKVNSPYVTLEQELEHIKNYMEIQKIRYPSSFDYYIECAPEIGKCMLPPLIIQNFVENSIKNSIDLDQKIRVYVLAEKLGKDYMRIRIADTGAGFPQKVLDAIMRFKTSHKPEPDLGVGISNAILRLDILYDSVPELRIYNSPAGGATVDILLPKKEEEAYGI